MRGRIKIGGPHQLSLHLCRRSSCSASARRTHNTAPPALSVGQRTAMIMYGIAALSEAADLHVTHPPVLDHCSYAAHSHGADCQSCSAQHRKGPGESAQAPKQRHVGINLPSASAVLTRIIHARFYCARKKLCGTAWAQALQRSELRKLPTLGPYD